MSGSRGSREFVIAHGGNMRDPPPARSILETMRVIRQCVFRATVLADSRHEFSKCVTLRDFETAVFARASLASFVPSCCLNNLTEVLAN